MAGVVILAAAGVVSAMTGGGTVFVQHASLAFGYRGSLEFEVCLQIGAFGRNRAAVVVDLVVVVVGVGGGGGGDAQVVTVDTAAFTQSSNFVKCALHTEHSVLIQEST